MTVGERTEGGWCIEGTEDELEALVDSVHEAIASGEHEAFLLNNDGLVPFRIERLEG